MKMRCSFVAFSSTPFLIILNYCHAITFFSLATLYRTNGAKFKSYVNFGILFNNTNKVIAKYNETLEN